MEWGGGRDNYVAVNVVRRKRDIDRGWLTTFAVAAKPHRILI